MFEVHSKSTRVTFEESLSATRGNFKECSKVLYDQCNEKVKPNHVIARLARELEERDALEHLMAVSTEEATDS